MNLTFDIGNTNLTLGLFKGDKLVLRDTLATKSNQYYTFLSRLFRKYAIDKVIVASVVPRATRKLESALKKLKVKPVFILGKNLVVPVKNRYQFPWQVGQDRLVNAFAAIKLYGSPAIVVDFGTAITFDAISSKQEYLGGMILPGIETSLAALYEKTALLPRIKLSSAPKGLIGKNTRDSMLSGVIFGFASLTDGIIKKFKLKLGQRTKVIGTGGNIKFISPHCPEFQAIDINLTLKGLNLILTNTIRKHFPT
jgi:type III pantothenate kinase